MAVEIEAKMAVAELESVRQALRKLGAKQVGRVVETNIFLDTKSGALLARNEGLRLRTNRDPETGRQTHIVTFKGPQRQSELKSREEVEVTVESATDGLMLLEKLGFLKTLSFEKRRESWQLSACKVELDELPYLGSFVEVEGPDEATVLGVRESLALSYQPIIKTSYIAMLVAHLKGHGLPMADVTFRAATC